MKHGAPRVVVAVAVTAALSLWPLLAPAAVALAQTPVTTGPGTQVMEECRDFASPSLGAHLRICEGTPWPARTEKYVMPLLAANRDKFKGKTVLDIGTGSGILALFAARQGASKVIATDIEPAAIACTRENAQRLGVASIVETRLVSLKDPSAYSVIRPGETFDIIVSFPMGFLNRAPTVVSGAIDDGITPNDTTRFGFSIVNGLATHLRPGGTLILCYRFAVLHSLMVDYARHLGYVVEHHPALKIMPPDYVTMFRAFAIQVALSEGVDPSALIPPGFAAARPGHDGVPESPTRTGPAFDWPVARWLPEASDDDASVPRGYFLRGPSFPGIPWLPRANPPGGHALPDYTKVDLSAEQGMAFPRLWGTDLDRILPGLMVIRQASTGSRRPGTPTARLEVTPAPKPASSTNAQSSATTSPENEVDGGCFEYQSELVKGPVRVCRKTLWPLEVESDIMTLMQANPDRFAGKTVLDVDTGSGILAIYAAQLGATKVVALDTEPRAVVCARDNARRLGLTSVIETRELSSTNLSAFSVIRPGEVFDVVVSAPPYAVTRVPFITPGGVDRSIASDDTARLGLSIIGELREHLSPGGTAVLCYRSAVLHDLLVAYARHLGFAVSEHPAQFLVDADYRALYNTFAAQVARSEGVEPSALFLPRPALDVDVPASYMMTEYLVGKTGRFPRLWDDDTNSVMPGLIVIRKQPAWSGQEGASAP